MANASASDTAIPSHHESGRPGQAGLGCEHCSGAFMATGSGDVFLLSLQTSGWTLDAPSPGQEAVRDLPWPVFFKELGCQGQPYLLTGPAVNGLIRGRGVQLPFSIDAEGRTRQGATAFFPQPVDHEVLESLFISWYRVRGVGADRVLVFECNSDQVTWQQALPAVQVPMGALRLPLKAVP